jgi:hypothetical protein
MIKFSGFVGIESNAAEDSLTFSGLRDVEVEPLDREVCVCSISCAIVSCFGLERRCFRLMLTHIDQFITHRLVKNKINMIY